MTKKKLLRRGSCAPAQLETRNEEVRTITQSPGTVFTEGTYFTTLGYTRLLDTISEMWNTEH